MVVYCFDGCSGLTSITIPSSVTSLGAYCFYGCKNLEIVYFKGKKCNSNYKILYIPTTCIIKVPAEYLQGIKIPLDLIINISMLGILTKQEKITSQLLSALLHQFLMAKAS